jgi:hypothetical protein
VFRELIDLEAANASGIFGEINEQFLLAGFSTRQGNADVAIE